LSRAIRAEYLDKGSKGLREFALIRLGRNAAIAQVQKLGWDPNRAMSAANAAATSADRRVFDSVVVPAAYDAAANSLARAYLTRESYYDAIRAHIIAIDTSVAIKAAIAKAFDKMKSYYPEATYPDVYFLVGRLATGGTTFGGDLLIGAELYSRDSSTPVNELSDWERAVSGQAKDLVSIVAHEYVHTLQGPHNGGQTLLNAALTEGTADFIAELIAGSHIINPAYAYGDTHADELWTEFKSAMDSTDVSQWLYNGSTMKGRPADLGYWAGYRIAKAYYDKASDKQAAVREILRFRDAKTLLAASGL
jgi:hypothetical protein